MAKKNSEKKPSENSKKKESEGKKREKGTREANWERMKMKNMKQEQSVIKSLTSNFEAGVNSPVN